MAVHKMESFKQWMMTVCLACVTAGILQMLTGTKKQVSGIKLVLALYILVTALAPISGLSVSWHMSEAAQTDAVEPVDTQQEILLVASQALCAQLCEDLAEQGIEAQVQVSLDCAESGEVEIQQVNISTSADEESVRTSVQALLGTDVPVEVDSQ